MQEQLPRTTKVAAAVEIHARYPSALGVALALACATIATAIVAYYPIQPGLFGAALIGYALVLWRWQWLWLLVVPMVTPAVDFTFWTGLIDCVGGRRGHFGDTRGAVLQGAATPRRLQIGPVGYDNTLR